MPTGILFSLYVKLASYVSRVLYKSRLIFGPFKWPYCFSLLTNFQLVCWLGWQDLIESKYFDDSNKMLAKKRPCSAVTANHANTFLFWIYHVDSKVMLHFTAYALHVSFEKTKYISLWNEKKIIQREILNEDDVFGKDRAGLWRAVESYPSDCKCDVIEFDMEQHQKVAYARGLQHSQVQIL